MQCCLEPKNVSLRYCKLGTLYLQAIVNDIGHQAGFYLSYQLLNPIKLI